MTQSTDQTGLEWMNGQYDETTVSAAQDADPVIGPLRRAFRYAGRATAAAARVRAREIDALKRPHSDAADLEIRLRQILDGAVTEDRDDIPTVQRRRDATAQLVQDLQSFYGELDYLRSQLREINDEIEQAIDSAQRSLTTTERAN